MLQEKNVLTWKGILCAVLYSSGPLIAINFHPQTVKKKGPLCTTWIDFNMIVDYYFGTLHKLYKHQQWLHSHVSHMISILSNILYFASKNIWLWALRCWIWNSSIWVSAFAYYLLLITCVHLYLKVIWPWIEFEPFLDCICAVSQN